MKILLTGGSGLLGTDIIAEAKKLKIDLVAPKHKELDITDKASVARALKKYKPEAVINAAAQVNVDLCEAEPEAAYLLNRDAVKNILEVIKAQKKPVIFVQISSSEVFGRIYEGQYKPDGYTEDEPPMPFSVYQKSKAEAEEITAEFSAANPKIFPHFYVVRAGWLFGHGRPTFVETFVKEIKKGGEINAIKDQWRTPTWTRDFARSLLGLVTGHYESGFYHSASKVNRGEVTTPQVIEEIQAFLGKKAKKTNVRLVSRNDIFKVPRAPSNVLLNTKLPKLPYWRDALKEFLAESKL